MVIIAHSVEFGFYNTNVSPKLDRIYVDDAFYLRPGHFEKLLGRNYGRKSKVHAVNRYKKDILHFSVFDCAVISVILINNDSLRHRERYHYILIASIRAITWS